MFDKLNEVEARYELLNDELSTPEVARDPLRLRKLGKEHAELGELVKVFREYKAKLKLMEDNEGLADDPELGDMAADENRTLRAELPAIEERLKVLLLPRDPNDGKNVVLEIRAGTGGDEAALFAGDLYRMYQHFAETRRWKVEVMSASPGAKGGFKEIISMVEGQDVFSLLKFESGVHRVQRVPDTETQGRIHTSACTVVVLPEAEEVEVDIQEKELRIDVYRSSGPGGQSVNTTDSAVRITHLPTGLVVTCQDEKSQHKNKAKALKILRARIYDQMLEEQQEEERESRRAMVRTGDRSEKIRTYNFPQDRLTDHRIGLTLHNLPKLLAGELDDLVTALRTHYQAEALQARNG